MRQGTTNLGHRYVLMRASVLLLRQILSFSIFLRFGRLYDKNAARYIPTMGSVSLDEKSHSLDNT